jgi:hypothetical protein
MNADLVYDLDEGGDNWIGLNTEIQPGSGYGDMSVFVPADLFYDTSADPTDPTTFVALADYLTLYSLFGEQGETSGTADPTPSPTTYPTTPQDWRNNGNFEEWSVGIEKPIQASSIKVTKFFDENKNRIFDGNDFLWTEQNL